MFDAATLVPALTVRENLRYARRLLGHREGRGVDEALELAGVTALAGERARALSLGQARKVAIARALLGAPQLLVLDEPLSGLDTKAVRAVLRLLRRLGDEGLTVLVSSHRMHEMETIVDEVSILMDGRVARAGTLEEILGGGTAPDSEAGERLRVRAAPADRAAELLERLDGVHVESREPVAGAAGADTADLHVRTRGAAPAAICAALVEAGCAVSALAPERATLHAVFEALLDAHAGEAPARRSA
jgi:ABC-2 type transport system ATP-binding protein